MTDSSDETPVQTVGKLVPRADGRGALWQGPAPGRTPAGGRPPNMVRAAMRDGVVKALPRLLEIAEGQVDGEPVSVRFQLQAISLLAKHGLAESSVPEALLQDLYIAVLKVFGTEDERVRDLYELWVEVVARHLPEPR